ncbi:MAG: hypothetical protein Ct9H300mP21_08440 [Pseudomonadota bacterium]|nr:MAG: hypothetical protein Ct9H300mP21_08440 [Pseudomonadota bacterium]
MPVLEGHCHLTGAPVPGLADERDFVTPEDLQGLSGDVLRHRIIESYEAESDGINR